MTLKKIDTQALQIGMYVEKLHGPWLSHPFWRQNFRVEDQEQIDRLMKVGIASVTVDTDKSLATPVPSTLEAATSSDVHNPEPQLPPLSIPAYQQASACLNTSLDAVTDMFQSLRLGQLEGLGAASAVASDIFTMVDRHPEEVVNLLRLKTKDNYTFMHSVAVSALMILLSRAMNFSEDMMREAALAGLLHDIGKSSVPDGLLKKPGPLNDDEFERVRRHPQLGAQILRRSDDVSAVVVDSCLYHHERYDGKGYPEGLRADETPMLARMVAVCDVYDAITSERPYKRGWDPGFALHKMATWKGHFDPEIFQAFVKVMGVYPNGSLVRLHSKRLAVVKRQNALDLLNPVVRVFHCAEQDCPLKREDIDLTDAQVQDSIAAREPREDWMFSTKFIESICQSS